MTAETPLAPTENRQPGLLAQLSRLTQQFRGAMPNLATDAVLTLKPLTVPPSGWREVVGTDGSVARERYLPALDAGPDWIETDFCDGFGREISRELPGTEGQPPWTETFDPETGQITRSRFDAQGNYYRESLLHGESIVVRSRSLGLAQVTEEVSGKLRGLPALPLTQSRAPRAVAR